MTIDHRGSFPDLGRDRGPAPLRSQGSVQARLYAQLLVSEIRLYHEEAVLQGRLTEDLGRRLAGPIAAARAIYARRFEDASPFEAELIRVLAGGEARRMGE